MATIRTSGLPADFKVKPWVQAFVDAVADATGMDSFGTYQGHEPTADLAVDIFVPVNDANPGIRVCDFSGAPPFGKSGPPRADFARFGIDYVIFRQHIYNPEVSHDWRAMADRGGVTQNHFDHVHVSFNPTAPQGDSQEEYEMAHLIREGEVNDSKNPDGTGDSYFSDLLTVKRRVPDAQTFLGAKKNMGVVLVSKKQLDALKDI